MFSDEEETDKCIPILCQWLLSSSKKSHKFLDHPYNTRSNNTTVQELQKYKDKFFNYTRKSLNSVRRVALCSEPTKRSVWLVCVASYPHHAFLSTSAGRERLQTCRTCFVHRSVFLARVDNKDGQIRTCSLSIFSCCLTWLINKE